MRRCIFMTIQLHLSHSRRHGGAFEGLTPKQSSKPPKLNYEALSLGGVFIKFQNVKPPWTNVKPPFWKLSGDGSDLSHNRVECETKFLNAAWQLQITIWRRLLGQRKSNFYFLAIPMATFSCLISEPCHAPTLCGAYKCLSLEIKTTFLLQYPVYAINRTTFFKYECILKSYAKTRL